ncbi:cystathionine gamma-synthase [Photobacterium jeanii]|uniref:Cytochrome c-type biogenesis protein n=1 Tax=Photobacterium jeanii TaxID=858640 RepID=A0A178KP00_9GAMM|nr:cytochrome c-type biogenesis protein [Photobacterium jeanii]OAN18826.1 cystathionine gamma-synthase [Photobacterium jeanii]PST92776.1 cytochrome c-type biogenesis protein CcmH [Photobacterium jeanii]
MKRFSMLLAGLMLALLTSTSAVAAIEVHSFDNVDQEEAFQELTATLRCPKCQNNTIADSDAPLARDMRQKVYDMLQQGKDKEDVVDYMVARYGNFVTYEPPVMLSTIILWLGPLFFIVGGFTVLVLRSRRNNEPQAAANDDLDEAEAKRLKAMLAEMEQDNVENKNDKVEK